MTGTDSAWRDAALVRVSRVTAAVAAVPAVWGAVEVARADESIAAAAIVVLYGALAVAAAGPVLRAPLRSLLALGGLVVVGAAYLWVYGVTLIVAGVFGAATIGACLLWPLRGAWALFLVTVLAVAAGAAVDVGTYTSGLAHDRALDLRMILAFVLAVGGVSSVVDIAVGALRGALRREREQQAALDREAAAHRALEARLAHAEDDARRRLAQELHDDIGQQMTALRLALGLVPFATDDGDARARLLEASVLAGDLAGRVALLASGRHPERLQRDGLAAALGALFAGLGRQAGLAVEVDVPAACGPSSPTPSSRSTASRRKRSTTSPSIRAPGTSASSSSGVPTASCSSSRTTASD
ncbi:MAG: histidine kinase, partial [Vicinamibacteria bacterium]